LLVFVRLSAPCRAGGLFPLTPALSLRERENCRQLFVVSNALE
jgi:hypothetical protein